MDSPVAFNVMTRSSSDDGVRTNRGGLSGNVQNISSSLDSWKERRKLKMGARGQLDVSKGTQADSTQEENRESVRITTTPSSSQEDTGEIRATDGEASTQKRQRPRELSLHETVPSTRSTDRSAISSKNISSRQRSSSNTSSSGISPHSTSPASPSSHPNEWEKAEESRRKEDIRSSQTTDRSRVVSRSGGAQPASSSSFLDQQQQNKQPTSPCSPLSPRPVSATSLHGCGGSDNDISRDAGEDNDDERCLLSRRKRASEVLIGKDDAHTDAKEDSYRSNSKTIGSGDTNEEKDNNSARDVDDGVEKRDYQQKNILTQNSEDDEMWNVDFTAIEATETLSNENARQRLLLRRKSSLAQRHRPSRTRKRISDSGSESESNNLTVDSSPYETKKNRETFSVDLPRTDEYRCSTEPSPKVCNEISEVPPQNVLRERKDPGLQLKKEKDQENRAVLDTTPVVLRKNSYNSFDNTPGNRKPLIQEISFEGAKPSSPEKTVPFVKLRRTPRHHELLRGTKDPQSSEDLSDKSDSPQIGSDNFNVRRRNSDLRKEINRNSFPFVETQPRVLRSLSRVDRRVFEDGPKSTISTPDDDWLKKRRSTPPIIVPIPQKDSPSSKVDSNGDQKTEKWSVIRQPLDPGADNRNTQVVSEKPTWLKKNLDARRTHSYHFTPPAKESDSNETQEAPWVKEFRNSRKKVGRIFNNRDPIKPESEKPTPIETPSPRISKPLSSLVASEQSSRGIVSAKVSLNASPSLAAEKKERVTILPEVSVTPKYKVERKSSFNNIHETGISSSMKENRSPVSRNTINTTEPYLPSWSVADAGEAPASLADTRGEVPEWQRKLAEKNKLKKQSFRRIEDSSSPNVQTEDGGAPPKPQPAWRQQLKNRTTSVDQADKIPEKPDWIKQAEERRARLAKTKLLGGAE